MSRPLTPFVRHLGEAKHRLRQLQLSVDRARDAAIAAAGMTGGRGELERALADVREHVRMIEALAARWESERAAVPPSRGAALRAEIAALLTAVDGGNRCE